MSKTAAEAQVIYAEVPGASESDLTVITLAHPLTREQDFTTLGLPFDRAPLTQGVQVGVRKDHAQSLIGAGYAAGVDPDDSKAVRAVLRGEKPQDAPAEEAAEAAEASSSVQVGDVGDGADVAPAGSATDAPAEPAPVTAAETVAADKGTKGDPRSGK